MTAPRIGYHRFIASSALALLHVLLALSFAFGSLSRRSSLTTGGDRLLIVSYIDSLGPVWQIGFGSTAAMLILGLIRHRWLALAHTLGGAAVAVFACALWFGFVFSDPRPPVLAPLAYVAITAWHLTIGVTYARLADLPLTWVHIPDQPAARPRTNHRKGRR